MTNVAWMLALFPLVVLGCDKAPADSGSAASASASSPGVASDGVTVKAAFKEFSGTYDGARAVAWKYPSGDLLEVKLAMGCPRLDCAALGGGWTNGLETACPQGTFLTLPLKEVKPGKQHVIPRLLAVARKSTGTLRNTEVDVAKLDDAQVVGTINLPDNGGTHAKGSFTAAICNAGK